MRKYLMGLLAMMFLLSTLTLFAQPPLAQGGMGQEPAQSSSTKTPKKKAKKEKKAKTTKKAKKAKKEKSSTTAPQ